MTKSYKDLLIQARDALLFADYYAPEGKEQLDDAIADLNTAIDEPEPEPFRWYSEVQEDCMPHALRLVHKKLNTYTHRTGLYNTPLYLHPQP